MTGADEKQEPVPVVEDSSSPALDQLLVELRAHAGKVRGKRVHYHRTVDTYADGIESAISIVERFRARQVDPVCAADVVLAELRRRIKTVSEADYYRTNGPMVVRGLEIAAGVVNEVLLSLDQR